MICVIATIELAENRRKDFLATFEKLVPKVQAEAGCIEYGPMIDLPTSIPAQLPPRDNVITVVEKWESIKHLETHLIAPHMLQYRHEVKEMAVSTSLQILMPA